MLVIVCGLQGSGKTTVAQRLGAKIDAALLRTDVIRKELCKEPKYTDEEMQKVYDEIFSRTPMLLQNKSVVLDATFYKQRDRDRAKEIAHEAKTGFQIVEVVCDEEIIKKRIEERYGDESEANFEHYLKYKRLFESIVEDHIVIDNSGSLEDIDKQLEKYF